MATIFHQVGIAAPVETVFRAIATPQGIGGWWTRTTGDPLPGGELVFDFDTVQVVAEVTGYRENDRVEWTVRGEEGDWLDTRIVFELYPAAGQVMVNFQHADWHEANEMFAHCSTKWAVFLLSLKDYVETGAGMPYPHDIQVNHY